MSSCKPRDLPEDYERQADEDIAAGRVESFDTMEEFIKSLDANWEEDQVSLPVGISTNHKE